MGMASGSELTVVKGTVPMVISIDVSNGVDMPYGITFS
jgi:hypothetical protein